MNSINDEDCKFCGSTLYKRSGVPHCSGDNLHFTKRVFDQILELESENIIFSAKLEALRDTEESFDLFMSYWNLKKQNPDTNLECIHRDTYWRNLEPETKELPMPPANTPLPDLAEVYLAEIMLGRELTHLEKDGTHVIPKIDEEGNFYRAPLTWISFPISYMSDKRATDKIKCIEPLPKIFNIEEIRGLFKDG